jgi:hypothetical protein
MGPSQTVVPGSDLTQQTDFVATRMATGAGIGMNTMRFFGFGDGSTFTLQPQPGMFRPISQEPRHENSVSRRRFSGSYLQWRRLHVVATGCACACACGLLPCLASMHAKTKIRMPGALWSRQQLLFCCYFLTRPQTKTSFTLHPCPGGFFPEDFRHSDVKALSLRSTVRWTVCQGLGFIWVFLTLQYRLISRAPPPMWTSHAHASPHQEVNS